MIVLDDQNGQPFKCSILNIFDQIYPFKVSRDPRNPDDRVAPSVITRAVKAAKGGLWVFGSDGGVARVTTTVNAASENCGTVSVDYQEILTRQRQSKLLSNTVSALVVGHDESLWLGTALGLLQRKNQETFKEVLFNQNIDPNRDAATLEVYFQAVSRALFSARPLTSVRLGGDIFPFPLVKQDLIFSAVEDDRRIWAGTLGGGLRRIKTDDDEPRDTLHLTKSTIMTESTMTPDPAPKILLGSNNILSLAVGPDRSVWAATDEGVSRIQDTEGTIKVTNFTALDGLKMPVWDIAVEQTTNQVWLATEGGLFRLMVQEEEVVTGLVKDAAGKAVMGVVVVVVGTPFRAITDENGRYTLHLPPGSYRLRFESGRRENFRNIDVPVTPGEEVNVTLPPVGEQMVMIEGSGVVPVGSLQPLVVKVLDRWGAPVEGVNVRFTLVDKPQPSRMQRNAQEAFLLKTEDVTGPTGKAEVRLSVGHIIGTSRVQATIDGLSPKTFEVIGIADQANPGGSIQVVGGNHQFAIRGESLAAPFVVQVMDQFANPISSGETLVVRLTTQQGAHLSTRPGEMPDCSSNNRRTSLVLTSDPQALAQFYLGVCRDNSEKQIGVTVSNLRGGRQMPAELTTAVVFQPIGIATEADGALVGVDASLPGVLRLSPDGTRSVVSGVGVGQGEKLKTPFGIAVNQNNGYIYVSDLGLKAVLQVDPKTGDRHQTCPNTELSAPKALAIDDQGTLFLADDRDIMRIVPDSHDCTKLPLSEPLENPIGIAIEEDGPLFVADRFRRAIFKIDPDNGQTSLVSGEDPEQEFDFNVLMDIISDRDQSLVVVDSGLPGLIKVDTMTGKRTIFSGPDLLDLSFVAPIAITAVPSAFVVTDVGLRTLLRIDADGKRTRVQDIGSTPFLQIPLNLTINNDNRLFVADIAYPSVVINAEAGNPELYPLSSHPDLRHFVGVAATGNTVFLLHQNPPAVLEIDNIQTPDSAMNLLSDRMSQELKQPVDIVLDERREDHVVVILLDKQKKSIVRIAGDQLQTVSDRTRGRGPEFRSPEGIAVEASGDYVVVDSQLGAVIRVDPDTGDREWVSDANHGTGPKLLKPVDITVAKLDNSLVVVDVKQPAILRIDLNGNRTILSDRMSPGFSMEKPIAIAGARDGSLKVIDLVLKAVLTVDPSTGRRALVSR